MDSSILVHALSKVLPPSYRISEHFTAGELACKHCGRIYVVPTLLEMMEQLRKIVGVPLDPNSGYRCPVHNRNIGGSTRSRHCLGMAVDIDLPEAYHINRSSFTDAAENVAKQVGGGFHYYPNDKFVHIDCWPWPKDRRW